MAVLRREVFIASNFAEFHALREALHVTIEAFQVFPIEVIDLNRNRPHGVPPLEVSLVSARRSDVMILLVGDEYGGIPEGEKLSYAHLEYRAALTNDPTVLAFFVNRNAGKDSRLQAWKSEIKANQTVSYLDSYETVEEQADFIFVNVQSALVEKMTTTEQAQVDYLDSEEEEGADDDMPLVDQLPAEEIAALDRQAGARGGVSFSRDVPSWETKRMLRFPAEVAAAEQIGEASKAVQLGERKLAIQHLRRALELRPLDMEACYRLARLLVSTRQRSDASEALTLAQRAAKMAANDAREVWQAASLVVAAQAASQCGDADSGLHFAEQAVETASWFAATHIELARQHVERNDWNAGMKCARTAFRLRPMSLEKLDREPAFRTNPKGFQKFKKSLRDEVAKYVTALFASEDRVLKMFRDLPPESSEATPANATRPELLERMSILKLVRAGRAAAQRHLGLIRRLAESIEESMAELKTRRIETKQPPKVHANPVNGIDLAAVMIVGGATGCFLVFRGGAASDGWLVVGGLLVMSVFVVLPLAFWEHSRKQYARSKNAEADTTKASEVIDEAQTPEAAARLRHQQLAGNYLQAVHDFEEAALHWHVLSPSRSADGAAAGDLIRIDVSALSRYEDFELNAALLPVALRGETPAHSQPASRYQLFRVAQGSGDRKTAARWACYFDPTKYPESEVEVDAPRLDPDSLDSEVSNSPNPSQQGDEGND